MRMLWNTKTFLGYVEVDTVTVADDDGNFTYITEADWIEMGRMKGWLVPEDPDIEEVEECQ